MSRDDIRASLRRLARRDLVRSIRKSSIGSPPLAFHHETDSPARSPPVLPLWPQGIRTPGIHQVAAFEGESSRGP